MSCSGASRRRRTLRSPIDNSVSFGPQTTASSSPKIKLFTGQTPKIDAADKYQKIEFQHIKIVFRLRRINKKLAACSDGISIQLHAQCGYRIYECSQYASTLLRRLALLHKHSAT